MLAMPFVGALYKDSGRSGRACSPIDIARDRLRELMGEALFESEPALWEHTDYYRDELGAPLYRRFLFFKDFIPQDGLAEIKLKTIEIEKELSEGGLTSPVAGKRTVNLDPGYITLAKVVLSSKKDYGHRICIGKGVFAEVTLMYRRGRGFEPTAFTYTDYRSPENIRLFNRMRENFRKMIGAL